MPDRPQPEVLIAAATGNNAKVYRLNSGFLQPGKDADILLFDAALAAPRRLALEGLKNGDVTSAVGCFTAACRVISGVAAALRPPGRYPKIIKNRITNDLRRPADAVRRELQGRRKARKCGPGQIIFNL